MNTVPPTKLASSNANHVRPRRGISLVIVVLLVSMTMAVSFAVIHTQGTAITTQQNSDLRVKSRQAALAGMAVAIREAHSPNWIGTEVSFSKDLSESEHFNATYSTGDATLSEGDEDYDEYPYRVTILVTGHATDPNNANIKASHRVEAVIRLVPEAVDDKPTGWDELQQYTFCQREKDNGVSLTVPCRIEGPVRIRGKLDLCDDKIDWDDNLRTWYLGELYWMSQSGWPDYRPFNGPVHIAYSEQDSGTCDLLSNALHVPIVDATKDKLYEWSDHPLEDPYQLYPGGKTYLAEIVGGDIDDVELKPDAKTNPLGIFIGSDKIHLLGNVSMQGTLITSDSIEVDSGSNTLSSLTVPPYQHRGMPSEARFRLPTVISKNDFKVSSGVNLEVNGLTMIKDKVEIETAGQNNMAVTINGNVSAKMLEIDIRSEWDMSKDWWNDQLSLFIALLYPGSFFPHVVNSVYALNPQPKIQIKPDSDNTRYHWYSGDNPLFKQAKDVNGNDKGLTWEIIRWTDNP